MPKKKSDRAFIFTVVVLTTVLFGIITTAIVLFTAGHVKIYSNNGHLTIGVPPASLAPTGAVPPADGSSPTPYDGSPTPVPTYPGAQSGSGGVDATVQILPPPVAATPQPVLDGVLTTEQIGQLLTPSVVGITSTNNGVEGEATGTGMIFSADGLILTNNHVIEGFDTLTVTLFDTSEHPATLIGRDRQTDLAVLKIEAGKPLRAVVFGNSDQLSVGERAVCIGNPFGLELSGTLTQGVISAVNRSISVDDLTMTVIQIDAAVNPGNSGGPLINQYGQVVGVISSKLMGSFNTAVEGLGFAIPIVKAAPIINQLLSTGYIAGRPAIGITGTDTPAQGDAPAGFLVATVSLDSDAHRAGIKPGDIIYTFNGKTITTRTEINVIKNDLKAGDTITVGVYRDGDRFDVDFKLMDESGH